MHSLTIPYDDVPSLIGSEIPPSPWFMLDQERVNAFARLSDDEQWIHTDPVRTASELGSGTVVHGFLTLSMFVALCRQALTVTGVARWVNYGFNRVRFVDPVLVGSSIRLSQTIVSIEKRGCGVLLTRDCVIEQEGSHRPAIVAEWLDILYPS